MIPKITIFSNRKDLLLICKIISVVICNAPGRKKPFKGGYGYFRFKVKTPDEIFRITRGSDSNLIFWTIGKDRISLNETFRINYKEEK